MSGSDRAHAVLITGASGGLGAATAQALAGCGFHVYAGVRGAPGPLRESPGITVIPLDVTDPASIGEAAGLVGAERGRAGLHALINNAGVIVQGPLELIPEPELHRQFAVNVYGPALVTQAFLPLLRAGRGRLINISAPTARVAVPYAGAISASKAALESLSAAARVELAPWGIPVTVIEPGAMDTGIFAKSSAAAAASLAAAPPGRLALYQSQLEAITAALARQRTSPPEVAARVIVRAVRSRRPKPRYTAGADARLAGLLTILPTRARDRLLARTLRLPTRPAAGTAPEQGQRAPGRAR